jgi:hypothetical protein
MSFLNLPPKLPQIGKNTKQVQAEMKGIALISGNAHPDLAQKIGK